jgi:hypothetical protein
MFCTLKTIIKRSPIAPLAASVYGLALPPGRRERMLRNLHCDRQTLEVMRRYLREESSCIDIGANEGEILLNMTKLSPRGRHVAFDTNPRLAAKLQANFPGVAVLRSSLR